MKRKGSHLSREGSNMCIENDNETLQEADDEHRKSFVTKNKKTSLVQSRVELTLWRQTMGDLRRTTRTTRSREDDLLIKRHTNE